MLFPKSGDPNVDCGMSAGGTDELSAASEFCGYSLPLKQYDIKCTVSG
jgi:hypothetical protein